MTSARVAHRAILSFSRISSGNPALQPGGKSEFLDVVRIPFEEALKMVMDGTIKDSKTMIIIMKAWIMLSGEGDK